MGTYIEDFLERARTGGQLSEGEQRALQLTKTDYEVLFRSEKIPVLRIPSGREYPMVQYLVADKEFRINYVDLEVEEKVNWIFKDLIDRFLEKGRLPLDIVEHRKLQEKMRAEDDAAIEQLMSERGMRL